MKLLFSLEKIIYSLHKGYIPPTDSVFLMLVTDILPNWHYFKKWDLVLDTCFWLESVHS